MIPSNKWFPSSLQDRSAWFNNFFNNLDGGLGTSLGLSVGDMTGLADDLASMSFCASASVYFDSFIDAFRQYRKTLTEGGIGDPAPVFPTYVSPGTPGGVPTGIFERLDNMVKRIRVAPAYTQEVGALLGIIPTRSDSLLPVEMKPAFKANAMPGNVVQVSFTRGDSDGIQIETKVDNAADWASAGKFFKSPGQLNIPDGTGLPHAVQIRARYVIGNEAVGLNSDVVNVVTTP